MGKKVITMKVFLKIMEVGYYNTKALIKIVLGKTYFKIFSYLLETESKDWYKSGEKVYVKTVDKKILASVVPSWGDIIEKEIIKLVNEVFDNKK